MKFIIEEKEVKKSTFGQVAENQFFVNKDGCLCQKVTNKAYHILANSTGKPYASFTEEGVPSEREIQRICETITKIEF